MILLSPDAVEDVERLRTFLDQKNPDAARRALAAIWTAITSDRRERAGDRVRFLVDDHQQDTRRSIRMTSILLPIA